MTPRERLVTAPPGIGLDEARRLLTANRIEKLPLVDDDGRSPGSSRSTTSRSPTAIRAQPATRWVASASRPRSGFAATISIELALIDAEVDALVLDIAHGHADAAIEAVGS